MSKPGASSLATHDARKRAILRTDLSRTAGATFVRLGVATVVAFGYACGGDNGGGDVVVDGQGGAANGGGAGQAGGAGTDGAAGGAGVRGGGGGTAGAGASAGAGGTGGAGGGNEAGTAGAGGVAAAGGGGGGQAASPCAGKAYLLCDDFEATAIGAAPDPAHWNVVTIPGAKAVVEGTNAAHGQHAVHLTMPAKKSESQLYAKIFPLPGGKNTLFGRAFFYVSAKSALPVHPTGFFSVQGQFKNGNVVSEVSDIYGIVGGGKMSLDYNATTTIVSKTSLTKGKWTCAQWEFNGDTFETRLWLDATEVSDVHIPSGGKYKGQTLTLPKFSSAYVGWITYFTDDAPAFDIWYDDVAFDVEKIGCE